LTATLLRRRPAESGTDSPPVSRNRVLRWGLRAVAAFVLLIVLIVGVTAEQVWQIGRTDSRRHSDVIMVLGAAQYDGRPSEIFAARLDHAAMLWRNGIADKIVTIGGNRPGDRFTEAQAGADYLHSFGVPTSDLVPVGKGNDTLISLRAAAVTLREHGWKSATLVTDPWHSLRSRRMAQDLGIDAVTSPSHSGPAVHGRLTEGRYIGRETVAYLYYRIFHRASPPGPGAV
jgi:uncharacterized SAM-binding protein YcdF (DUF218 family)